MADPRALEAFGRLVDIMARLRAPGGCPWDREQTPESLRPYLLEETYEVLDAIAAGDPGAVREELGDLLLQVVFHAQLGAEAGHFDVADVATAIADKLVRRHPHVFADVVVADADEVVRNWQRIKAAERAAAGRSARRLSGVSRTLPALARAEEVGKQARKVGLDWPDVAGVRAKLDEEEAELGAAIVADDRAAVHREVGDLLLTMTSLARHLGVSAELALHDATERFVARAERCEDLAAADGTSLAALDAPARDALWERAKRDAERV